MMTPAVKNPLIRHLPEVFPLDYYFKIFSLAGVPHAQELSRLASGSAEESYPARESGKKPPGAIARPLHASKE